MLSNLLALGLAAGIGASAPDSVTNQFVAALTPEQNAGESLSNAEGLADITISNDAILYRVSVHNLRHVTDVALVDEGRAVELSSPGDTREPNFLVEGTIESSPAAGIAFDELLTDVRSGKAQIVVFTTNEPGGAVTGKLVRGVSDLTPVAQPQPGALTS
jgi:hypothetical protein